MQGDIKILQAVFNIAMQAIGVRHEFVDAFDLKTFERQTAGHDQTNVARAQDYKAAARLEVLNVDIALRKTCGKDACGARAGNLDF